MGQLIMLDNSVAINKCRTGMTTAILTDVNGTSRTLSNPSTDTYEGEFYVANVGTTYTAPASSYPFPHASSNSAIPTSQATIPNEVGSCSIAFTRTNNGWVANITITGSGLQDETVNSLVFEKITTYGRYSATANFLYFAYILDGNGIELNADNNYTANLTMSVSFE